MSDVGTQSEPKITITRQEYARLNEAEAQLSAVRLELLTLQQEVARHTLGLLKKVWKPEKIKEWAERTTDG